MVGLFVKGVNDRGFGGLVGMGVWWWLAGRSGRPGFATVVSLICGGWVPQDLVSSHGPLSTIERGRWSGCS
jgi:hypothetical protein